MRVSKWVLMVMLFGLGGAAMWAQTNPPATQEQSSGATSGSLSESAPPPVQRLHGPVRVSGGVIAGNILTKVPPQYPAEAKAAGVGGTVVMHAIISKDGTITNLSVISGPEMLQAAAVDAVKQWTYRPYLLNGVATEVDTTIVVNFNLNRPKPQSPPQQDSN